MKKARLARRFLSVVCMGLAALLLGAPSVASGDEGGSWYCTTDCQYSFDKHGCDAGSQCWAQTCTGVDGRLYPYWVYCAQQE